MNVQNDSLFVHFSAHSETREITVLLFCRPQSLLEGMNRFLKLLDITFRRDKDNYRPRINKKDSVKDMEQKKSGNYFFLDED